MFACIMYEIVLADFMDSPGGFDEEFIKIRNKNKFIFYIGA